MKPCFVCNTGNGLGRHFIATTAEFRNANQGLSMEPTLVQRHAKSVEKLIDTFIVFCAFENAHLKKFLVSL